jgi:hypothetical protein
MFIKVPRNETIHPDGKGWLAVFFDDNPVV